MSSPIQSRILTILADGYPHSREELRLSIDEYASYQNVQDHVCVLRKSLRLRGQDIVCVFHRRSYYYQHVRLLGNPYSGYS
jgi:hypothetical protein